MPSRPSGIILIRYQALCQHLCWPAPPVPIAKLIGFKIVSIGDGKAGIEFEAGEKHANPMGTLRGGVLCDIVTCDVFDDKERLIARASCTCLTLRGEQAEGR